MRNSALAVALQVLAVAYAVLGLVTAGIGFGPSTPTAARLGLGLLGNGLFLGAAIVFGFWLADAYAWAGEGKHTKGWTIGSWYIPVGTIGTPHAPMVDLWNRATGTPSGARLWLWLISWSVWWTLSLVLFWAGITIGITAVFAGTGSSSGDIDLPTWMVMLGLAQAIATALAAVGLVLSVQRLQEHQVPAPVS